MAVDLTLRPRLDDMLRLMNRSILPTPPEGLEIAAEAAMPRVTVWNSFEDRPGYRPDFIPGFAAPAPIPRGERAQDRLPLRRGARIGAEFELQYQHFSVVMSRSRKMAMFTAVNIDGSKENSIKRKSVSGGDKWSFDGRLDISDQIGDELYFQNDLDRGHLVRREDPLWGPDETVRVANADTFHFTNCSPQMAGMNQKTWLSLESYILQNTRREDLKVNVFTGPVFGVDDRVYRGVRIPSAYWKVIAYLRDDDRPSATGYMVDQIREVTALEFAFGKFKTFQVSIRRIEQLTQCEFGILRRFDGLSNEEVARGMEGAIRLEINDAADILV